MRWIGSSTELRSEYTLDLNSYLRRHTEELFFLLAVRPGTLTGAELTPAQRIGFVTALQEPDRVQLAPGETISTAISSPRYAAC